MGKNRTVETREWREIDCFPWKYIPFQYQWSSGLLIKACLRATHLFSGRVISRLGDIPWLQKSSDLTTWDFFLLGYLQSRLYSHKPPHWLSLFKACLRATHLISGRVISRLGVISWLQKSSDLRFFLIWVLTFTSILSQTLTFNEFKDLIRVRKWQQ